MTYLLHVTLDTGDSRQSHRHEVDDAAVREADRLLDRAMTPPAMSQAVADMLTERGAEAELAALDAALAALNPAAVAHGPNNDWTLRAGAEGRALIGTFFWRTPAGRAPVITFGVAHDSRSGAGLWRLLHRDEGRGPASTDWTRAPSAPWLAARMEIGAATAAQDVRGRLMLPILADLERCIAWAWLERGA